MDFRLNVLIIFSTKKTKLFLFTSGFFVSTILLVLQILPVGPTMFSERYTLVPGFIFSFLLAYGLFYFKEKYKISAVVIYAIAGIYSLLLFSTTYKRCDVWQNSLTLAANKFTNQHKIISCQEKNITLPNFTPKTNFG